MRLRNLSNPEQQGAMLWLWKHMLARFGSTWTREYGEADGEAAEIWCEALGGLTGEQLKHGVDACKEWTERFPPNLAQFSKLCLTTTENPPEVQKYLNPPPVTKPNAEGFARIQREQGEVGRMDTERGPEFVSAYYACGLRARWGGLDKDKEAKHMGNEG